MGAPTRARKGKAGTLPEDSNVGDLLGTGRERGRERGGEGEREGGGAEAYLSGFRQRACFAFL